MGVVARMVAPPAQVVKLVDTPDLGSGAVRCVGSSPILGTFFRIPILSMKS